MRFGFAKFVVRNYLPVQSPSIFLLDLPLEKSSPATAVLLSTRGGDRRSQGKLLDCLCERCKPLSILSTVQSTSRSASSAIWFKIAAFALSGSASASRRYRTERTWFLGVIGGTLCAPLLRPDYAPLRTKRTIPFGQQGTYFGFVR